MKYLFLAFLLTGCAAADVHDFDCTANNLPYGVRAYDASEANNLMHYFFPGEKTSCEENN